MGRADFFLAKGTHVVLKSGELDEAVVAGLTAERTEVAGVVVVSQSGHVLSAVQSARDGIQRARQQMSLINKTKMFLINSGGRVSPDRCRTPAALDLSISSDDGLQSLSMTHKVIVIET